MIQFNLLPDVKQEYIKAERTKRLVISVCMLASMVAIGIFVLLMSTVHMLQKKNIADLTADIKTTTTKVQNIPNINRILTVQNQMGALSKLHNEKYAASRLFSYLGQVTPSGVTISSTTADFTQSTLMLTGNAPTMSDVNKFVDTLKFTTYKIDDAAGGKPFSRVVLSNFNVGEKSTSYSITLTFDPVIFDNTKSITMVVPNTITTRSVTDQPLFKSPGSQQ